VKVAFVLAVLVAAGLAAWWHLRPRPLAKLTLREGGTMGVEFPLSTKESTIGSEAGQTVVVSHPRVSRHHAVVARTDDGQFVLRDRSKHGTTVNGVAVGEHVLRSGDLIRLAESVDLVFTRLG
jgi:pSer/pThr/pTyr-binding forkhead associated (FHA) protein